MKKLVLLGAVAIVALSSCKKDYTCKCDGYEYTILESKSSAAKTVCEGKGLGKIGDEDGKNVNTFENESNCSLSKFK